ncbi:spore germination protein, amino acid permease [Desulfitobacterium dichloroeliminans LMG P-21439]|uniref:Spore germination protein, amino acid permease n=1 Tax=Desulfitobacterium dichloroeliminans (strain LMG P-21439 / DCA1) TaxID=871963 RepID=L0F3G9_DESDL|nr:endospore germination permease [Desulfitobacterium dichloroeliminans]AGA67600.1 spore germination protein, amino acid permease [Desulfitobacterium dichloroeliminans LMG P-21439]
MERISTHQFTVLSAAIILGTTFMNSGAIVSGAAGRDGWLAILPGFALGIPFVFMVFSLIPKFPNKNLIEITEQVLGKWLGKGIGLLQVLIAFYFGALLMGQGLDMYSRTVLPLMSHYVLVFGTFIVVAYLYVSGIEVLSRFSEVVFPITFFSLLFIAAFSIQRFERGELFPILDNGIKPLALASWKVAPWPMEYLLFLAGLLPFLPRKAKDLKVLKKNALKAFVLVIAISTIMVIVQIMTFGPFETARLTYGLLVLGNMIEISRTVAGVEAIFTLIWMGVLTLKVAAMFFVVAWGLRSVFKLKGRKVIGFVGLMYVFIPLYSVRGMNVVVEIELLDGYFMLPFMMTWVVVVWGVDRWKRRKKSS